MPLLLLRPSSAVAPPPGTEGTTVCEISFATDPLAPPSYTDVTSYLQAFSTRRGRSYEYDRMEAGTGTLRFSNQDGRFTATNTGSPYYPNVKPARRVRIRSTWASTTYALFNGFTDGYPQNYAHAGFDRRVTTNTTDWFLPLRQFKFPAGTTFPEQASGARIIACLDLVGIAAVDRAIESGNSTIAAVTDDLGGQSVLEHILLIAETENGRFFAAKDGKLTFLQRHSLLNQLTVTATFGDAAGELHYLAEVQVIPDDTKLTNRVELTLPNEAVVSAYDQTSINAFFERTMAKSVPLASAIEAQDAADYLVHKLKDANSRIGAIRLNPYNDPANLWPIVLGAEIGQRVRFRLRPKNGSDMIEQDCIVDGVSHDVQGGTWVTTLQVTPADTKIYWHLGVAGESELGDTTALAY